jgi:hypothetical protein
MGQLILLWSFSMSRRCPFCHQSFFPSSFCSRQRVCSQPVCQSRRRSDYRRQKLQQDPEYRQVCRESWQKWSARHPDYRRQYRQTHLASVERNRQAQRKRDRLRRLRQLGHSKPVAVDLVSCCQQVWLVGPELSHLDQNTLALSEVFIFQKVVSQPLAAPS